MNSLVGYASSEEEEDDVQPEKPAKIAKTEPTGDMIAEPERLPEAIPPKPLAPVPSEVPAPGHDQTPNGMKAYPPPGPQAGPALAATVDLPLGTDDDPPVSPRTYESQRIRELTMPSVPNFDIPDSPPPPPTNSEEAAVLAASTKKFERFLELKKQGVHFNERLQNSSSLRNPSLLRKLMDFAGISKEDSYRSSLSEDVAVAVRWPEECYVESLVKANERWEKKRGVGEKVDFVAASNASREQSAKNTPGVEIELPARKSKFDRK